MAFLALGIASALTGCGGAANDASTAPSGNPPSANPLPPAIPPPPDVKHGRFSGKVTIGGVDYYGDAMLTADGKIRLYVAEPYSNTGALQPQDARSLAQFVGSIDVNSTTPSGTGVVIGEFCSAAQAGRFCGAAMPARVSFVRIVGAGWDKTMSSEIVVSTALAEETWRLELGAWVNYYLSPASLNGIGGLWSVRQAEFAGVGADTVVRLDSLGQLFFQSANSGCTGNGVLIPHLDGKFNVFDVRLNIAGCAASFATLNGDYEGLASSTASSVWNYDEVVRLWLSTDNTPRVAATVLLD
jgi:hypothetical protein